MAILPAIHANAQVNAQPAADPAVSAQNEPWYQSGEPVTFAGNIYHSTGPLTYFNRYEMIRSGFFRGVPIYTRTTIEPYSMIFVPIGNGLMQPYERLRAGDVAGTVGSTTPSFPVVIPSEQGVETTALAGTVPQAPAPPTFVAPSEAEPQRRAAETAPATPPAPQPTGTSGTSAPRRPVAMMRTAERPRGLNAFFVAFEGDRWFNNGAPVERGRLSLEQIGEYHGLPVYARAGDRQTIYIPVQRDASTLLAAYSRRHR